MAVFDITSDEYTLCKQWIASQIQAGHSWEDVKNLCVAPNNAEIEFERLQNEELIIPFDILFHEWSQFVAVIQSSYTPIVEMYGLSDGSADNALPVPTDSGSAWTRYKNHLLGKYTGRPKMSESAVATLENNCHWILNHLKRDTRSAGAVKGLVMGSVQSGKTANMIGLVTMAAHYDWNFFIILSGTIDNLRKQTRDRFLSDLTQSGGVNWHVLDYTRNADYLVDINDGKHYLTDDLALNIYQEGTQHNNWMHRYVIVCLKNSTRLKNLITWLHSKATKAARMRLIVIDDEADQASVNTRKMKDVDDEEIIERTAVNQLIIDLVKGNDIEGKHSAAEFQAMNYISFTATPYANVLNEAYEDSLYPRTFICSLPESKEYFGAKAIFGSKSDDRYNGLNIIRTVPKEEVTALKQLHKGCAFTLPKEFQHAVCWFLSAAAVLRGRGHKKPISMLIHTTQLQGGHFEEYDVLKSWLLRESKTGSLLHLCREVYDAEKAEFLLKDLAEGYPEYALLNSVCDVFPEFDDIENEIKQILSQIVNIGIGEDSDFEYCENGIHLCVDNCRANKKSDEGVYLRIVYPKPEQLSAMSKAPVFIVLGGNTLARGLTLDGLLCTYFARNVNQADTLMQMARWFGYRKGYELLQRIWMPLSVQEKFELLEEIDEKLKEEFESFMRMGKSPATFGPRVMSSAKIAKFMLTSKTKSQNAVPCEFDFSGDSYETTQFDNNADLLLANIKCSEAFLTSVGTARKSDVIEGAYVWANVSSHAILHNFLEHYHLFDCSPLHVDIPIFRKWMEEMNKDGKYLKWNIAVSGDKKSETRWKVAGADVGTVERSKKTKHPEFIDIGSLRSGIDVLADVNPSALSPEETAILANALKSKKNLLAVRHKLGLGDVPLLLLYRIDQNKGKDSKYRTKIGSVHDIIGFSIIISGEEVSSDYVKTIHVKTPE